MWIEVLLALVIGVHDFGLAEEKLVNLAMADLVVVEFDPRRFEAVRWVPQEGQLPSFGESLQGTFVVPQTVAEVFAAVIFELH